MKEEGRKDKQKKKKKKKKKMKRNKKSMMISINIIIVIIAIIILVSVTTEGKALAKRWTIIKKRRLNSGKRSQRDKVLMPGFPAVLLLFEEKLCLGARTGP